MVRSMTGYGRADEVAIQKKIFVEIKSVNHRYLDCNIRAPKYYGFLEEKVREYLSKNLSRGKIDVYITTENLNVSNKGISLNTDIVKEYLAVLEEASLSFGIENDMTVSKLSQLSDVFKYEYENEDEEEVWETVKETLSHAFSDFVSMREREGERLKKDLIARSEYIGTLVDEIDRISPQSVENHRLKLTNRIKDILGDTQIDESRILTEAAIFADKIAVAEETVRLKSHIKELHTILGMNSPSGKKLDFLIQEFNREANTISSKANDIEISKIAINLKSEIEKMREQVQNIE